MKKIIVLVSVLILSAAAVFANGNQENPGPWGTSGEKLTVTGKLNFNEWGPQITTGGKTYELMVPGYGRFIGDYVKEGQTVTVQGYSFTPGPRSNNDTADVYLRVTDATVDGKTYALGDNFPGRGGMMGGRFDDDDRYGRGPQGGPGMMGGPGGRGRW